MAPSCQPASRWALPGPDPGIPHRQQHYNSMAVRESRPAGSGKTLLQQLTQKAQRYKEQPLGISNVVTPGHLQQQQELLKHPQIMLKRLLLTARAWLIPVTPQWAELGLKERAGSLPHFSPASQPCFSQKQGQVEVKPSILQELLFQDHSHLTHVLQKGFLTDHGLQAQAPLSTTFPTPRNPSPRPRNSWP